MRNYSIVLLLIVVFYSCSNDFDLTEEPKDIPVVYGILSPVDTAHYIRIEKAFIDEKIPADELAQNPDNLYYDHLVVTLARCVDFDCNSYDDEFLLHRVDGNLEGYVREEGFFAQSPNYLYKVHSSELAVESAETYILKIDRGGDLPEITAKTTVVENPRVTLPHPLSKLVFLTGNEVEYNWKYLHQVTELRGSIFNVILEINYRESVNNSSLERKKLIWKFKTNVIYDDEESGGIATRFGEEFLFFLRDNLEIEEETIRILDHATFILESGGSDFIPYRNLVFANVGITSTQPLPVYTNLSEGRGLFLAKNEIRFSMLEFTEQTLLEIQDSEITKDLNFQ